MDDQEILQAFNLGILDGDLAIIGTGNDPGKPRIPRAIPSNDTQVEPNRAQTFRQIRRGGTKLPPALAEEPLTPLALFEPIREFASLIGWRQHDRAAEIRQRMV